MKKWSNTFKKNNTVYRNAAVSVYLANTITPARVYDANNRLYYTAPQGHTDIDGYIEFYFDPSEYPTGQLFDITCTPNGVCDTDKAIRYTSLLIFTSNWSGVTDDDTHKPEDDADVTANQFAQSLGSIDSTTVNFDGRNDRDDSAITVPAIATDGTAIDHTINTDGSADISFEWSWSGGESDIDGFVVYVRGSTSSASYDFGTTPSEEITFYCRPDRRHFILKGVAANLYWTFGVSAYRIVDPDVNTNGFIATAVVQPSASGEDPYRPSANIAFAGNITGTVNDKAVSSVVYHDGSVIKRTDGTGVDADSLPESTARKWAGESGADVTPPLPSDENLVGYWSFDEGQGTIARDSSGNNNTGTLNGTPGWVNGITGRALDFEADNDQYVSIPDSILTLNNNFTLSFWACPEDDSTNSRWVTLIDASDNFQVGQMSDERVFIRMDSTSIETVSFTIAYGTWYHVVVVRSGGAFTLYINSVKTSTSAGGITADGQYSAIGGGYSSYNCDGIIDEVRIYNTALTVSQIKALYLNPGGNKAPIPGADKTGDHSADIDVLQTTNAPAEAGADVTGNNTANDSANLSGVSSSIIRSGSRVSLFNGFEDSEFSEWVATANDTIAKDTDSFSGTYAALMTSTETSPGAGNTTDGVYLTIPEEIALAFATKRVKVTVYAKQPGSNAAAQFAVSYSTNEVGNSGWQYFTPTTSYAAYSFIYEVPAPSAGGTDFLGIWADTSGGGLGTLIDNVSIETIPLHSDIDALQSANGPAEAGANVTETRTANNTTYVNDSVTEASHAYDVHGIQNFYQLDSSSFNAINFYDYQDNRVGYLDYADDEAELGFDVSSFRLASSDIIWLDTGHLDIPALIARPVVITSDYTIPDYSGRILYLANTTDNITITLPDITNGHDNEGLIIIIKDIAGNSDSSNVNVVPCTSSQTIEGNSSWPLNATDYAAMTLVSGDANNPNWYRIASL